VLAIEGLRGDLCFLCCLIFFKESTRNLNCRLVGRERDSLVDVGNPSVSPKSRRSDRSQAF